MVWLVYFSFALKQYLNRGCTRYFATKETDKQILQNRKSPEVRYLFQMFLSYIQIWNFIRAIAGNILHLPEIRLIQLFSSADCSVLQQETGSVSVFTHSQLIGWICTGIHCYGQEVFQILFLTIWTCWIFSWIDLWDFVHVWKL